MSDGIETVIYPVSDLARAKALYGTLLGVEPSQDESYYVGFDVAGQGVGLDPNGHKGATGPVVYWRVADIASSLKALIDDGAETLQEVHDVGGGKLIARVKDADGNVIGLAQSA
ncbi:glyoxalase [Streptomyces lunaelactis]|uniref:VOC family protein n=1 Tax=Streptomyces lunaelactis TaxID=1535768 RepID=UPI0015849007|nr:VOC family protein [Streptomyces lunaelactis]NUK02424.1 glyoxalase [Streptomyces lunaelactis]NUK09707.1 glyoxalase [Streptomyces lunaelactis]NUK16475.1 glyoxalase [Streptomyces lunaelactis]NUK26666.1 glyoxalase [Streptomyces lunaelactis]NUK34640.1 glyoxalase [Streptomyces lunaelactis]